MVRGEGTKITPLKWLTWEYFFHQYLVAINFSNAVQFNHINSKWPLYHLGLRLNDDLKMTEPTTTTSEVQQRSETLEVKYNRKSWGGSTDILAKMYWPRRGKGGQPRKRQQHVIKENLGVIFKNIGREHASDEATWKSSDPVQKWDTTMNTATWLATRVSMRHAWLIAAHSCSTISVPRLVCKIVH